MHKREDVPREQVTDERKGQGGGWEPIASQADGLSNPSGHDVFSASPCDPDPKTKYTVPDCAYKGFDSFTWPEGKVSCAELPDDDHDEHQPDDIEEFKPYKR